MVVAAQFACRKKVSVVQQVTRVQPVRDDFTVNAEMDIGEIMEGTVPTPEERALLMPEQRVTFLGQIRRHVEIFDDIVEQVRRRVRRPPYWAVIRGAGYDKSLTALKAFACALGEPVQPYPDSTHRVFRQLRPREASSHPQWGVLTEWLHTDSTNWAEPHDVTMMLCARPDQNGTGASQIIDGPTAMRAVVDAIGTEASNRLVTTPLPWAVAPELGGRVVWAPAFTQSRVRWQLFRVWEARQRLGREDSSGCDNDLWDFLTAVDKVLSATATESRFTAAYGDLIVLNNRCALHRREPVADPVGSRRVMVHCKVQLSETDYPQMNFSSL